MTPKIEVLPASTGCRPPGRPAGEHVLDYSSSYPGLAEIGCWAKTRTSSGNRQHHAVSTAMYGCKRCDAALLVVSAADDETPVAVFEVTGAEGPEQ